MGNWRQYADRAQEVILDELCERDASGTLTVRYEPAGGTPRLVRGIFTEPHVLAQPDPLTAPASTWAPRIGVKVADLLPEWPIPSGSRFVLLRPPGGDPLDDAAEARYEVVDRQLDGEGMVDLYLRRKD